MLIGIGIPCVLMFFEQDGKLFNLTIERKDELSQAEVDTINSIYDLSEGIKDIDMETLKNTAVKGGLKFVDFVRIETIDYELEQLKKNIDALKYKADGFHVEGPKGKFGKVVYQTPILIGIRIPFRYSIGIGVVIFIIGTGLIIVSLIGMKGRTQ